MTPNVNIYGQPNTWLHVLPISGYHTGNTNYIPAWQTIAGGITAGKITLPEPLDNSFSYAAIAEDAPAAGVTICRETEYSTAQTQIFEKENILPLYMNTVDNGQYSIENYDLTTNKDIQIYSPNTQLQDNNLNYYVRPLVSMSPKDIVLHVGVWAYNTDWTAVTAFNADDYINTYAATYPHIIQIFASVYFRDDDDTTRYVVSVNYDEYGGFYFGRDIEFECPTWGAIRDYALTFQHARGNARPILWGLCTAGGCIPTYNSANYVHKFIGNGGTITVKDGNIIQYRDYDGAEWIKRVAASYGVFFTLNYATANTGALNNNLMYLGVFDENGLLHGDYTHGAENETQPQYNWTSTNDSDFNPNKDYDNTIYNNTSTLNGQTIETFNTVYAITADTAHKLASVLSNAMASRPAGDTATDWALDTFLTNNPLDCIVSLKKFPCSVPISGGALTPIYFGSYYNATVQGFKMGTPYHVYTFSFSNADRNFLYPVYGDCFLDYEPYTHAELYIPFCGSVPISIADFMGHSLTVDFVVDFLTGACAAYIKKDGVYITSAQGNCALDIPVSGIQGATLDSQIFHAAQNAKSAHFNAAAASVGVLTSTVSGAANVSQGSLSAVTGGINGFTSGLMRAENATLAKQTADYEQSHIQTPYKMVSGSSPLTSQICEYCCRLIIYRPKLMPTYNPEIYANTVGFACLINGKVKDFSGLTVGEINLDGVPCSAEEKQMIYNEFARGVIL